MESEHIKAGINDLKGKAKEAIGKATGDKSLEAEGHADQLKGKAQDFKGDIKDALD